MNPTTHRPRTVVVHHRSGIGDLVWHVPYLRAIAAQSAGGRISLIARPSCRAPDLLAGEPCIDDILEFDRKPRTSEQRRGQHDSLAAQWAFVQQLRARRFERIVIFAGRVRYAALAVLAGIPERIGFGFSRAERWLLNRPPFIARHHGPGNWVYPEASALALAHGWVDSPQIPRLAVPPALRSQQATELASLPHPRHAFILGASAPAKNWGAGRFGELAAAFAARGLGVLLLGGPAEAAMVEQIVDSLPDTARICVLSRVAPSVLESAAALAQCDFALGNDTGALNLAAAVGLPCLGLFGATPPLAHDPNLHALSADGMARIWPEDVLARLTELGAPGFSPAGAMPCNAS